MNNKMKTSWRFALLLLIVDSTKFLGLAAQLQWDESLVKSGWEYTKITSDEALNTNTPLRPTGITNTGPDIYGAVDVRGGGSWRVGPNIGMYQKYTTGQVGTSASSLFLLKQDPQISLVQATGEDLLSAQKIAISTPSRIQKTVLRFVVRDAGSFYISEASPDFVVVNSTLFEHNFSINAHAATWYAYNPEGGVSELANIGDPVLTPNFSSVDFVGFLLDSETPSLISNADVKFSVSDFRVDYAPVTEAPTESPTTTPTQSPTVAPTNGPTASPVTEAPTGSPTITPTQSPTVAPTSEPTASPTFPPTRAPTVPPVLIDSVLGFMTKAPLTVQPMPVRTVRPSSPPTPKPTAAPTSLPTASPTVKPTATPTNAPTRPPTASPTAAPTHSPTKLPTRAPTRLPTHSPTSAPTVAPTRPPTSEPTQAPTEPPAKAPTRPPTSEPTQAPTEPPAKARTRSPTSEPTQAPTEPATKARTMSPTSYLAVLPTASAETKSPIKIDPTASPTVQSSSASSLEPTRKVEEAQEKTTTSTPTMVPTHLRGNKPEPATPMTPHRSDPTVAPSVQATDIEKEDVGPAVDEGGALVDGNGNESSLINGGGFVDEDGNESVGLTGLVIHLQGAKAVSQPYLEDFEDTLEDWFTTFYDVQPFCVDNGSRRKLHVARRVTRTQIDIQSQDVMTNHLGVSVNTITYNQVIFFESEGGNGRRLLLDCDDPNLTMSNEDFAVLPFQDDTANQDLSKSLQEGFPGLEGLQFPITTDSAGFERNTDDPSSEDEPLHASTNRGLSRDQVILITVASGVFALASICLAGALRYRKGQKDPPFATSRLEL